MKLEEAIEKIQKQIDYLDLEVAKISRVIVLELPRRDNYYESEAYTLHRIAGELRTVLGILSFVKSV